MAPATAASETVDIEALPHRVASKQEGLWKGSCSWYLLGDLGIDCSCCWFGGVAKLEIFAWRLPPQHLKL